MVSDLCVLAAKGLKWLGCKYLLVSWKAEVYIERYYLVFAPYNDFFTRLPNAYLHNFRVDIPDEFDHDHARWCMSIVLTGGYTETRNGKLIERLAGSVSFLRPGDLHRIKTVQPDTWTIFVVGPRFREMNFYWPESGKHLSRKELRVAEDPIGGRHKETPAYLARLHRRQRALAKRFNCN